MFKEFLKFCETGILDMPHSSEREMDSPFEVAVRDELTRLGYQVDAQVGSAGFFIDFAVVDPDAPGRYLIGIECDGQLITGPGAHETGTDSVNKYWKDSAGSCTVYGARIGTGIGARHWRKL